MVHGRALYGGFAHLFGLDGTHVGVPGVQLHRVGVVIRYGLRGVRGIFSLCPPMGCLLDGLLLVVAELPVVLDGC